MKLSKIQIAAIVVVGLLLGLLAWEYWPFGKKTEEGDTSSCSEGGGGSEGSEGSYGGGGEGEGGEGRTEVDPRLKKLIGQLIIAYLTLVDVMENRESEAAVKEALGGYQKALAGLRLFGDYTAGKTIV